MQIKCDRCGGTGDRCLDPWHPTPHEVVIGQPGDLSGRTTEPRCYSCILATGEYGGVRESAEEGVWQSEGSAWLEVVKVFVGGG